MSGTRPHFRVWFLTLDRRQCRVRSCASVGTCRFSAPKGWEVGVVPTVVVVGLVRSLRLRARGGVGRMVLRRESVPEILLGVCVASD